MLPDKENQNPNIIEGNTKKGKKPGKEFERSGTIRMQKLQKGLKVSFFYCLNMNSQMFHGSVLSPFNSIYFLPFLLKCSFIKLFWLHN